MYQEEHGIDGLKFEDAVKKIKERPYDQYKEEHVDGMEPLKNEKLAKKSKLRKYIKKIKIQNLKDDDVVPAIDMGKQVSDFLDANRDKELEQLSQDVKDNNAKKSNINNPFKTDLH